MAAVMGEGGGIIGSAATSIRRALSIATTLKGILGLSEFEKGMVASTRRPDRMAARRHAPSASS